LRNRRGAEDGMTNNTVGHTGRDRSAADGQAARQKSPRVSRDQRMTVIYGILCILLILVVLQLWLLTATMNAYLGGDEAVIWPAAMASLVCFGLGAGLLQYLYALERPAEYVATEGNTLQLTMATGTFAVCFAVFGSASA